MARQVTALTDFLHERDQYVEGQPYEVSDDEFALFRGQGLVAEAGAKTLEVEGAVAPTTTKTKTRGA